MVEEELLLTSYDSVQKIMQLINEGKKQLYELYLLNPSLKWHDVLTTLYMFVFILTLRFLLSGAHHRRTKNFPSIFRLAFSGFAKPGRDLKLNENLWYTLWHSFSFIFGLYVLSQEGLTAENPGWSRKLFYDFDVKWYWFPTATELSQGNQGWPFFPVSNLMRMYYLTELAFWLSCAVYLSFETIRDDFYALMLHHSLTCLLISFSYTLSFWRIGTVILATHDFADIILYATKSTYYIKSLGYLVDILFSLFAVGFFVSRLVIFPLFCIRPVFDFAQFERWTNGVVKSPMQIPGGIVLSCALCILQTLHVFWFVLILKMVFRGLRVKAVSKAGDIRSEDESSEKSDDNKKTPEFKKEYTDSETSLSDQEQDYDKGDESDQRMKLSSLPGVRATLTRKELYSPQSKRSSNKIKKH